MSTKKVFRTLFSFVLAFTLAFSSCFCALAEEKKIVQVYVYEGVAKILYEDGTIEEVDPATVSADILSEYGAGIEMFSTTDDSELSLKGEVTVSVEDGRAEGIVIVAEEGNTSQMSVEGTLDVTSSTSSDNYSKANGVEISAYDEGSTASLDMVGDITVTAESENGSAYTNAINANSTAGATVEVKADGNVSAAANGSEEYYNENIAVQANADGKGSSTDVAVTGKTTGEVHLNGSEGASASFESGKGVNGSVYVNAEDEASVTLTVKDGGIEAEESTSLSIGNKGADVKADVTGDIKSTGNQGIAIEQSKAENEIRTKIKEDELPNNAPYVNDYIYNTDNETLTFFYTDYPVEWDSQEMATYEYSVSASLEEEKFDDETHPDKEKMTPGDWWYDEEEDLVYREYIYEDNDGNEIIYTSTTKLSSERTIDSAEKITHEYEEKKANTQLSVEGNVSVESKGSTAAMTVRSDNSESTVSVSVVGDLSAKTTEKEYQEEWEDTPYPTFASGLQIGNDGGIVNIDITGNIDANGAGAAAAIMLWNTSTVTSLKPVEGAKISEKKEDDMPWGTDEDGNELFARILEDGRWVYYNGTTMQVYEPEEDEYYGGKVNETNLSVTGDVTSNDVGMNIGLAKEQKADVLIDGTLEGKNTSIVLASKETIVGENLTLTVWEVIPDKDNNIVSRETWDNEAQKYKITGDAETEKALQYIIRINPEQTDIISAGGTKDYNGYDVAHEGDTVTLKLNIPAGYEIIGAYGDVGQNVSLLRDANGNYYLVVPRGGGVELSVKLGKAAPVQAPVSELFRIRDKAETTQIIFYSNGTFHARLLKDSSKACTGRFRAVDGGIVLINNGETEEDGMKITRNTETNLYDLLFHFAEKVGVTDSYTFELEENDVAILLHISK